MMSSRRLSVPAVATPVGPSKAASRVISGPDLFILNHTYQTIVWQAAGRPRRPPSLFAGMKKNPPSRRPGGFPVQTRRPSYRLRPFRRGLLLAGLDGDERRPGAAEMFGLEGGEGRGARRSRDQILERVAAAVEGRPGRFGRRVGVAVDDEIAPIGRHLAGEGLLVGTEIEGRPGLDEQERQFRGMFRRGREAVHVVGGLDRRVGTFG